MNHGEWLVVPQRHLPFHLEEWAERDKNPQILLLIV